MWLNQLDNFYGMLIDRFRIRTNSKKHGQYMNGLGACVVAESCRFRILSSIIESNPQTFTAWVSC